MIALFTSLTAFQNKLIPVLKFLRQERLYTTVNPVPAKALLNYINIFETSNPRLPLVNLSDDKLIQLVKLYENYKDNDFHEVSLHS